MATLASALTNQRRPVPLEGLPPDALLESVRAAREAGLLDELGWLSPPAAAAALYELAAALPPSDEKRDIGRRVLRRMHDGDAATFVALATQLALGSRRVLSGAPIRARVALALDLPLGAGARVDGLALALISRRELQREWLRVPSTGSLPARRLAARLLERAARESVRRATEGDDSGVRVFRTASVQACWEALLGDRESLVWRHVASARGLLARAIPELGDEIERHLDPGLTPTEWRRAAASLAASIALEPDSGLRRCRALLESDVLQQDRGVASTMIFGLPRAAEAEPEAVEELLEHLVRAGGLDAAEALVDLRRERIGEEFGLWAAQLARAQLREALDATRPDDDGRTALMHAVLDELAPPEERAEPTLRDRLSEALEAFAERGAREAYQAAHQVLEEAEGRVRLLEGCGDREQDERHRGFRALRELDLALCESDTLGNLLMLGATRGRDDHAAVARPLGALFERMTNWLVLREGDPIVSGGAVPHFVLRLRRLRTMLHRIDADGPLVDDRSEALRARRLLDARVLLTRVRDDARTPLRRALCASTARACDALVREEIAEVSDVLVAAGMYVRHDEDLQVLAEASMVPDIEAAVGAYHRLQQAISAGPTSGKSVREALDALTTLANELPVASSPRVEALRSALLELAGALEGVAGAASLAQLAEAKGSHETLLGPLEAAVHAVAQLVVGARRRLGDVVDDAAPSSGSAIRLLDLCVERAQHGSRAPLESALGSARETLQLELPAAVAEVATAALARIRELPAESDEQTRTSFLPAPPKEAPLPPWMPPSRTLGGFYVLRALGSGAVGSVFVARRVEQRKDPSAERFALKVPEYDADAARMLSEEQFQHLFREEAGALLALPDHPNIARFVTFDAGARPKPILVMELVEGPTLERALQTEELDMARAVEILQGLAAGLEAMHAAGVGHLDVKPSNVILREGAGGADGQPVLVDFGLAGRHVRPGCGTAEYGGPEIWGAEARKGTVRAEPADVYAFGCMAYELLTGRTLFQGPHEMALLTAHLQHDGMPRPVQVLHTDPRTAELGELLRRALRRDPAERSSMAELRGALSRLAPQLAQYPWPLGAAAA